MNRWWEKVEHYNNQLIPYALVLLLLIIIVELAEQFELFHLESPAFTLTIHIMDYIIIAIFVIDLIFLAKKSKDARFFFRNYWLDILAVFPLNLLFTAIGRIYELFAEAERIVLGQAILHETVEVEKIAVKESRLVAEEGKVIAREGKLLARSGKIARFVRIAARGLRLITKSRLFTKVKRSNHRLASTKRQRRKKER